MKRDKDFERKSLIQLKQENKQLAYHLQNMIEINSKEETSQNDHIRTLERFEKQVVESANEKFGLLARINELED
jgi:hypothetical protein